MLEDLPDDWQHADMAAAIAYTDKRGLAIDCGAHRGIVTRFLLQHFQRVVSIEPSELADQIHGSEVIKKAVGHYHAKAGMAHGQHNTGQRHIVEGDEVEIITLDSLELAPDFIKLDIEGMEYFALMGGEQTIRTHQPVIILEENGLCNRYGIKDGQTLNLLRSWGATLRQKRGRDYIFSW